MDHLPEIALSVCLLASLVLNAAICLSIVKHSKSADSDYRPTPGSGLASGIVEVAGGVFRRANKKRRPVVSTEDALWKLEQDSNSRPMR